MRTTKRPKIIPLRARLSLAARQKGSPDNPVHIRDPELGKWTSRLVVWTCALVLTAVVSAAISFFTLRSINGQLNEMQAEQRPWVYVTDFNLASPLTVDNKLKFRVNYTAKNVGKSTAADVRPNAILILTWINSKSGSISSAGDSSFHAVEPRKIYENQNFETRARQLCDQQEAKRGFDTARANADYSGIGDALFPNETDTDGVNIEESFQKPESADSYIGVMVFCLNYKASVNERFSTRYVITVTHITKDGLGNAQVLDPARANIPANEIFLGIGGRYAD